ncbi:MAG: hypothetical protein ABII74_08170, partial [Elusimicrobiota bacterium]
KIYTKLFDRRKELVIKGNSSLARSTLGLEGEITGKYLPMKIEKSAIELSNQTKVLPNSNKIIQNLFKATENSDLPVIFARVTKNKYADDFMNAGKNIANHGNTKTFVTSVDDLAGIKTQEELANRLTLYDNYEATRLNTDKDTIILLKIKDPQKVKMSIPQETNPPRGYGYVAGGKTKGGAREWEMFNGKKEELKKLGVEVLGDFKVEEIGGKRWQDAVNLGKKSMIKELSKTETQWGNSLDSSKNLPLTTITVGEPTAAVNVANIGGKNHMLRDTEKMTDSTKSVGKSLRKDSPMLNPTEKMTVPVVVLGSQSTILTPEKENASGNISGGGYQKSGGEGGILQVIRGSKSTSVDAVNNIGISKKTSQEPGQNVSSAKLAENGSKNIIPKSNSPIDQQAGAEPQKPGFIRSLWDQMKAVFTVPLAIFGGLGAFKLTGAAIVAAITLPALALGALGLGLGIVAVQQISNWWSEKQIEVAAKVEEVEVVKEISFELILNGKSVDKISLNELKISGSDKEGEYQLAEPLEAGDLFIRKALVVREDNRLIIKSAEVYSIKEIKKSAGEAINEKELAKEVIIKAQEGLQKKLKQGYVLQEEILQNIYNIPAGMTISKIPDLNSTAGAQRLVILSEENEQTRKEMKINLSNKDYGALLSGIEKLDQNKAEINKLYVQEREIYHEVGKALAITNQDYVEILNQTEGIAAKGGQKQALAVGGKFDEKSNEYFGPEKAMIGGKLMGVISGRRVLAELGLISEEENNKLRDLQNGIIFGAQNMEPEDKKGYTRLEEVNGSHVLTVYLLAHAYNAEDKEESGRLRDKLFLMGNNFYGGIIFDIYKVAKETGGNKALMTLALAGKIGFNMLDVMPYGMAWKEAVTAAKMMTSFVAFGAVSAIAGHDAGLIYKSLDESFSWSKDRKQIENRSQIAENIVKNGIFASLMLKSIIASSVKKASKAVGQEVADVKINKLKIVGRVAAWFTGIKAASLGVDWSLEKFTGSETLGETFGGLVELGGWKFQGNTGKVLGFAKQSLKRLSGGSEVGAGEQFANLPVKYSEVSQTGGVSYSRSSQSQGGEYGNKGSGRGVTANQGNISGFGANLSGVSGSKGSLYKYIESADTGLQKGSNRQGVLAKLQPDLRPVENGKEVRTESANGINGSVGRDRSAVSATAKEVVGKGVSNETGMVELAEVSPGKDGRIKSAGTISDRGKDRGLAANDQKNTGIPPKVDRGNTGFRKGGGVLEGRGKEVSRRKEMVADEIRQSKERVGERTERVGERTGEVKEVGGGVSTVGGRGEETTGTTKAQQQIREREEKRYFGEIKTIVKAFWKTGEKIYKQIKKTREEELVTGKIGNEQLLSSPLSLLKGNFSISFLSKVAKIAGGGLGVGTLISGVSDLASGMVSASDNKITTSTNFIDYTQEQSINLLKTVGYISEAKQEMVTGTNQAIKKSVKEFAGNVREVSIFVKDDVVSGVKDGRYAADILSLGKWVVEKSSKAGEFLGVGAGAQLAGKYITGVLDKKFEFLSSATNVQNQGTVAVDNNRDAGQNFNPVYSPQMPAKISITGAVFTPDNIGSQPIAKEVNVGAQFIEPANRAENVSSILSEPQKPGFIRSLWDQMKAAFTVPLAIFGGIGAFKLTGAAIATAITLPALAIGALGMGLAVMAVQQISKLWTVSKPLSQKTIETFEQAVPEKITGNQLNRFAPGQIKPGTVLQISAADKPVELNGQTWLEGQFIWDGRNWQLDGAATCLAGNFAGIQSVDGRKIPVVMALGKLGLLSVGINGALIEDGRQFKVVSPTVIEGLGTIYAGNFSWSKTESLAFGAYSLVKYEQTGRTEYIMPQGKQLAGINAEVTGNSFQLLIDNVPLPDGQTAKLSGNRISGTIADGLAKLNPGSVISKISLKSACGLAEGKVELSLSETGLRFNGIVNGHVAWKGPNDIVIPVNDGPTAKSAGAAGVEVAAGDFEVVEVKNGLYHLDGKVGINEGGLTPFIVGTQFKLGEKAASIKINGTEYEQWQAGGKFLLTGVGSGVMAPEYAQSRDKTASGETITMWGYLKEVKVSEGFTPDKFDTQPLVVASLAQTGELKSCRSAGGINLSNDLDKGGASLHVATADQQYYTVALKPGAKMLSDNPYKEDLSQPLLKGLSRVMPGQNFAGGMWENIKSFRALMKTNPGLVSNYLGNMANLTGNIVGRYLVHTGEGLAKQGLMNVRDRITFVSKTFDQKLTRVIKWMDGKQEKTEQNLSELTSAYRDTSGIGMTLLVKGSVLAGGIAATPNLIFGRRAEDNYGPNGENYWQVRTQDFAMGALNVVMLVPGAGAALGISSKMMIAGVVALSAYGTYTIWQ